MPIRTYPNAFRPLSTRSPALRWLHRKTKNEMYFLFDSMRKQRSPTFRASGGIRKSKQQASFFCKTRQGSLFGKKKRAAAGPSRAKYSRTKTHVTQSYLWPIGFKCPAPLSFIFLFVNDKSILTRVKSVTKLVMPARLDIPLGSGSLALLPSFENRIDAVHLRAQWKREKNS